MPPTLQQIMITVVVVGPSSVASLVLVCGGDIVTEVVRELEGAFVSVPPVPVAVGGWVTVGTRLRVAVGVAERPEMDELVVGAGVTVAEMV